MTSVFDFAAVLPEGAERAVLIGRAFIEGKGAVLVHVHGNALHDASQVAATSADLLELADPAAALRADPGPKLAALDAVLKNSVHDARDSALPWLLAPCDLQAVKASGVTFVESMLERVIEEQARGDQQRAEAVRRAVTGVIGDDLAGIVPGSAAAAKLKQVLLAQNAWSQYLEVGIGPDAEVFTKSQPMSSVGWGAEIGLHPGSEWNNPEPEVVLAVDSTGKVKGAALGNDVNLRDFEGRSALLLGKAKDNNASCAIGPFIRLFDGQFGIDDVRACDIAMTVTGADGFVMHGSSSLAKISRDPLDLVAQTIGKNHQYPDGL
ncbi:MAG: fumarylacetoacetate hydrolase, partial [Burkholderiales bacterium]